MLMLSACIWWGSWSVLYNTPVIAGICLGPPVRPRALVSPVFCLANISDEMAAESAGEMAATVSNNTGIGDQAQ
jgi:hypothetical protein